MIEQTLLLQLDRKSGISHRMAPLQTLLLPFDRKSGISHRMPSLQTLLLPFDRKSGISHRMAANVVHRDLVVRFQSHEF